MILTICGKGGCGKSTITSLMARELANRGKKVLVMDMDESNFGLYKQLGLELPKDFTLYFGFKKGIFKAIDSRNPGEAVFPERWSFDTLPSEFVSGTGSIKLLAVGKIHEAGEGCACPMGSMAKEILDNLDLKDDEIVLVDTEAGVEHFGRGIDAKADRIFMIADPSFESISLTQKIGSMCETLQKPFGIILNKLTPDQEDIMRTAIGANAPIAGVVYQNNTVLTRGLLGQPLEDVPEEVKKIADLL